MAPPDDSRVNAIGARPMGSLTDKLHGAGRNVAVILI
jgi:hypothetical protein